MQSSKHKGGLSETPPNNKTRPATPKGTQLPRARSTKTDSNSPSTLQKSKTSIERSPKSVNSKSVNGHLVSKISNPDKQQSGTKGTSELQNQLDYVQEELKKTNERLTSVENEKAQALEELKNVNEKLDEAVAAKKSAEDSLEVEKFRADEIEQANIDTAQKIEEELQKRLEIVQSSDAKALASAMEEIESLRNELSLAVDAKKAALDDANNAKKIAEANAAKAERVSAEVKRLRNLLNSRKDLTDNNYSFELARKLEAEVELLKHELNMAKCAEDKVAQMEEVIEDLKIEISDAKRAESEACVKVNELKKKAESLEIQVDEASRAHRSSSVTLASAMKEMEESNTLLLQSQAEVDVLKEKLESLMVELDRKNSDLEETNCQLEILKSELKAMDEIKAHDMSARAEVARKDVELEESERRLELAKREMTDMRREMEILKSELKSLEEAKDQALNNEKTAVFNVESLMEEKNKLVLALEAANGEIERLKKAMDDLSSAMREVSGNARDTREMLFMKQAESEAARAEIEELKLALKNIKESYEVMLDEAKYEIVCLKKAAERMEGAKEGNFIEVFDKSEEEIAGLEESKKPESLRFQEKLLEKEIELQRMIQENGDLHTRVEKMASLLEEVKSKDLKENGNNSMIDESPDESEHHGLKSEIVRDVVEYHRREGSNLSIANGSGSVIDEEPVEVDAQEYTSEREAEAGSADEELDPKKDSGSFERINELPSETMENGQKKRRTLFNFGGLLKKKNNK